jgi:hypothetical protein
MTLYTLLTAARGRQLLKAKGWSDSLNFNVAPAGARITVAGTVSAPALMALLPGLSARGRTDPDNVKGLQLLCEKYDVEVRINGTVCGEEMTLNVVAIGVPANLALSRDSLICALQDDLAAVCKALAEDADMILGLTGAQYEGANIFERVTPHFIVAAEAWDTLPASVQPDEKQTDYWLNEILCNGSEVLSVGLVVFRDFGMIRMGDHALSDICVIRPGIPVRRWLPRQDLARLAADVRRTIHIDREITASFAAR